MEETTNTDEPKKKINWKKYYKKEQYIPKKSKKSRVLCKCPMCGKEHKFFMYWTGRLPARIYCENCTKIVANETYEEPITLILKSDR